MTEERAPKQFAYDAFATYATNPDRDLVRDVENFIEGLHRERLLPKEFKEKLAVCVDGQDFRRPDSRDQKTLEQLLHGVVRSYQGSSRCLLVFSGDKTAQHPWINDEVTWWREQPDYGPIFFVLTHGQLGDGPEAYRKLLPEALIKDATGLYPLYFDLRGYRSEIGWRRLFRFTHDQEIWAESRGWDRGRLYDEERFQLAARVLSLRIRQDLSPEDLVPKWEAAWRLKRRLRRVQMWVVVVMLAVAVAEALPSLAR